MPADPPASAPRICLVLSTGRCGSTALSGIVRAHPDALSVSELFSALCDHDLIERELTGAGFWDMLSTPSQTDLVGLRCEVRLDEMLYPAFDPRPGASRFSPATGLPPLIQVVLPHLTERPDDSYARLEDTTRRQPRRRLSEHLRWLFGALAAVAQDPADSVPPGAGHAGSAGLSANAGSSGRVGQPSVVVERSGGSLAYAAALMRLFPQARVVHLFRDGRECALSMSRHGRYKMAAIRAAMHARLGYDPYAIGTAGQTAPEAGPEDEELAALTPGRITRAGFDKFEVPLRRYGTMWSKMIIDGLAELPGPPRLLPLDYADLVARPGESIGRLLDFLGLERDPGWERRAAGQVRPGRDAREEVSEQQWGELTRACRLGMNHLYGRGGWT